MAKQNRQKKVRLPDFVEDAKEIFIRKAAAALVALVFAAAVFFLVKAFLYRSDYFRLRVVETRAVSLDQRAASAINNQVLSLYKGRNIFSIPLGFIAKSVRSSYADVKEAVARIALPDRIVLDVKLRRPVALVRNSKLYPIDEDGVVLPPLGPSGSMQAAPNLPVIDGIDLHYGRRGSPRNLKLAMDLIREIRQARFMAPYGLVLINASDPRNLSFYINNGIEVRIGSEDFRKRLEALAKTLKDPMLIVEKIKYIDVRFDDVAIGPR
jgi:cell division septal protein FtsQ